MLILIILRQQYFTLVGKLKEPVFKPTYKEYENFFKTNDINNAYNFEINWCNKLNIRNHMNICM